MTIRVLHVVGAMDRAGAETMIMNLYRSADRDRVQFDFLVHENRPCDYDEEIRDLGGSIWRVPRFNGANAASYTRACRKVIAASGDPIVHGHIGSSAAVYLREAKKLGRVAVAHSHAQHYPLSLSECAFRLASYPTRFVADEFLACSRQAGLDRFGSRIVCGDHFHVVPNGIDIDRYRCDGQAHEQAKRALGLGPGPIVGHIGRLESIKNHDFLFDVVGAMIDAAPGAQLVLYGKGSRAEELRRQACEKGLQDRIHFQGLTEDVPAALRAFDVMVFPSLKEGLAMALIEAQASGMPVVFSEGVPRETGLSGRAIRLPLEAGAEVWAQAVINVLCKGEDRAQGADIAANAGFDVSRTAAWLTGFYESLALGAASTTQ